MENFNGPAITSSFAHNPLLLPPRSPIHFNTSVPKIEVHHYRASFDGNLLLDQPSWLDELLSDQPVESSTLFVAHRRSSSDSATLSGSAPCTSIASSRDNISSMYSSDTQKYGGSVCSNGKCDSSNNNTTVSKVDSKRTKQQFARSSRLRKLQYIAELERSVQILQVEGSEVSAALQYLDQQALILGMENRALKQRLDNLSQEQLIKYLEQEMLEREIARLQVLYYQQQQKQQQQHHKQKQQKQKQKRPTYYQSKNRKVELQLTNLCI